MAGYSCEPGRKSPYSADIRWRIVWQREVMRLTVREVARNLCVGVSTVWRINRLFNCTGNVTRRSYPTGRRPYQKLTDVVQLLILHTVVENPGLYLREIKARIYSYTEVDISPALLCGFLKKMNFSRQKMQMIAKQRDEELRSDFREHVAVFEQNMLVFVDETGMDRRDSLRRYGYSLRGMTPKSHKMLVRGERISIIAIMTVDGILNIHTVHGSADGDVFLDFVEQCLLPCLMPFDGKNPNSVVILDNCSIHHVSPVVKLINDVGAIVQYLPPYSPDYNPIEWCFSKVKHEMSALEQLASLTGDIELVARTAFAMVTPEDCQGWINDTGIYAP